MNKQKADCPIWALVASVVVGIVLGIGLALDFGYEPVRIGIPDDARVVYYAGGWWMELEER